MNLQISKSSVAFSHMYTIYYFIAFKSFVCLFCHIFLLIIRNNRMVEGKLLQPK